MQCRRPRFDSWVGKICWRIERLPTPVFLGFPCGSAGKESACNAGDSGSIPGLGRSAGERIGYPLQYSWASLVAQLVKNPPAMRETGFDPWVGKIPWRRERLPTPVFWPEEFHGLYSPWGCKESDMTEQISLQFSDQQFLQIFYLLTLEVIFPEAAGPLHFENTHTQRMSSVLPDSLRARGL